MISIFKISSPNHLDMDDSPFIEFFGNYPRMRVLDFLLANNSSEYSKTELARCAGISFNSLETFWNGLLTQGVIRETRKIGNARLYGLNQENPLVADLMLFDKKLLFFHLQELEEKIR